LDRGFILKEYGRTKIYEIPSFNQTGLVSHGFTTRVGGVGGKPYDTLNLAFHVGDSPEVVINNRQIVCHILGAKTDNIVSARQVHGADIAVVDHRHAGCGALAGDTAIPNTDGLITDRPGLLLATFYADCVPIFILDPLNKVIGSVHAGWKGTAARIGAKAVKIMEETYGSDPGQCLVGIGPSIGPCCYEVDRPVIEAFQSEFGWWPDILLPAGNEKARLDLWTANLKIMVEAGIDPDNVELARICSCCNQHIFFSYRGSHGKTGRMGAFLMLKP